jgi:archaellum component FlaC
LNVLIEINLTHENAEDSDQGDAHMLMKYQREMLQKVEKIDNQIIKIEKEINQTKLKIWRVEQELRSVGYLYEIVSHHVSQDVQKKEWEIPIIKTE